MQRLPLCGSVMLSNVGWSSAFITGKVAIAELDPFAVLTLRFLLSAFPSCAPQAFRFVDRCRGVGDGRYF